MITLSSAVVNWIKFYLLNQTTLISAFRRSLNGRNPMSGCRERAMCRTRRCRWRGRVCATVARGGWRRGNVVAATTGVVTCGVSYGARPKILEIAV
jgi:hypothetical protein